MNPLFRQLMGDAARMTRDGDLHGATAAIQNAIGRARPAAEAAGHDAAANDSQVVDVTAREVPAPGSGATPSAGTSTATGLPRAAETPAAGRGEFVAGRHAGRSGAREYKLFVPPGAGARPLPLIVMLHGCTQDPDDFAAGTTMNEAARIHGFYVLYPAQSQQANPQRCWNWFKHNHQSRGRGEPELLAGMTREVMARHTIEPARVYVAGLSAGGAMAAILGDAYPDLFAAVGVHSGLPTGSANDVQSAFGAMKQGATRRTGRPASGVPTIVFHGDADSTVHPGNADHVIAASVGGMAPQVDKGFGAGGRSFTRRVHRNAAGEVVAEHWVVHGAQHAWSGGSPKGSFADPRGPDATHEMVRFFMEHPHRTRC
jgi:poly(hydroxyalkanoate) depolymerase family esterase